MTIELFENAFSTSLAAPVAPGDATIHTQNPAPSSLQGGQFRIAVDGEYMLVTGGQSGTTWNVTRGIENGSTAASHAMGAQVVHDLFAGALRQFFQQTGNVADDTSVFTAGTSQKLTAAALLALAGGLTTTSADSILPPHVRVADTAIDLNRPWSDGVTNWPGVNPGDDITLPMQAAINFLGGVTGLSFGGGVTAIGAPGGSGGEIYFSRSGNYVIGTTVHSGTSGGNPYQGVILFPGITYSQGVSIRIRGTQRPVWSSETNQPGVKFTSAVAGAEMFSCPAAGSGSYPALSQLSPQFERITFVNTADGGVLDGYSSGSGNVIDCLAVSTLVKGAGTRRAYTMPHQTQHGDMLITPIWVLGGYKTGVGVSEHFTTYGWHAVSGVQNVLESLGAGATVFIGGNLWLTNCDSLVSATSQGIRIVIENAAIESGGNPNYRLLNDPNGNVTGKINLHLTQPALNPKLSLCAAVGGGSGNGTEVDIESGQNEPGGWHGKHPNDTFRRAVDPLASSDVPGLASDTWHPIFVSSGGFTLSRTDSGCGVTNGSNVVTDASITAADQGRTVTGGAYGPGGAYVFTVTPGVSFTVSSDPLVSHPVNYTGITGTVAITLGVSLGNQPGQLLNANPGVSTATAYYPVKNALTGGESRSVTKFFTTAASGTYNLSILGNRVNGTNGPAANNNSISAVITAGKASLNISGSGTVAQSAAGLFANATSYAVTLTVVNGADGLVKRAFVDVAAVGSDPVRVCDHILTATERAAVGVGKTYPYLQDGLSIGTTDNGSMVTGFSVRQWSGTDLLLRGAITTYTATQGVLNPGTVNPGLGVLHQVQVNDAAPITIPNPIDPPDNTGSVPSETQQMIFEFFLPAQRVDASAGGTNGNPVITDAAVVATDQGRSVTGTGIPANSFVGTVIAGTSFRLSSSATSQVDVNFTGTTGTFTATIGGTMGTITFNASGSNFFKMGNFAIVAPTQNKRAFARFFWNGLNWVCMGTNSAYATPVTTPY